MCCRAWFLAVGLLIAVGFSACSSKNEAPPPAPGETGTELTEADKKKLDDLKARFNQMRENAMAASADKAAGTSDATAQQAPTADAAQTPAEEAADASVAEQPTGPRPSILLGAFLQPLNAMMQNSLQAAMNAASQAVPAPAEAPATEAPAAETPAAEPSQN